MHSYRGRPFRSLFGTDLGSLCVIDRQPRWLEAAQVEALKVQAREVMARLELRHKQKELEEQKWQLAYSEEQYRSLFEESAGYLFTHTLGGTILSANRAVVNALGFDKEALLGKNISQLLPREAAAVLKRYYNQIHLDIPASGVTRVITATGQVQYWQHRNFATCNAKGEPYVICSAQDVTDKERVANTLRNAKGELEAEVLLRTGQLQTTNAELSRTKAELDLFIHRASHDLKGPLCSMEGLLQLARLHEDPLAQEQYLTLMQQTVRKLNRVLDSLVSYSKNTHQRIAYQAVDFDLLLESVRQSCRTLKGFERVSLQTHLYTPNPFLLRCRTGIYRTQERNQQQHYLPELRPAAAYSHRVVLPLQPSG